MRQTQRPLFADPLQRTPDLRECATQPCLPTGRPQPHGHSPKGLEEQMSHMDWLGAWPIARCMAYVALDDPKYAAHLLVPSHFSISLLVISRTLQSRHGNTRIPRASSSRQRSHCWAGTALRCVIGVSHGPLIRSQPREQLWRSPGRSLFTSFFVKFVSFVPFPVPSLSGPTSGVIIWSRDG